MTDRRGQTFRYWIDFDPRDFTKESMSLRSGCGVTAFSVEDALGLVNQALPQGTPLPRLLRVDENVAVEKLPAEVRANLGDPSTRGIWFPK
jgi:hypothetical protein